MARHKEDIKIPEVPEVLEDPTTHRRYVRGRFLGKGGFARCYELTDLQTRQIVAGKIVPKVLLSKPHQKDKMTMEIAIHRSLNHPHIVAFHGFFEDKDFVYVLLELCRRRSMMELHKRRKTVTEPEARYYMMQTLKACLYLHDNKVIHRDLKLGNLFLNDELEIKVGDFGLATKVDFDGERKRTLCGTPNYIAPEVLGKKGHSYEVDAWSIGCIMYTLLCGKPPFETHSLKETYMRIRKNEYFIPQRVSPTARALIAKLLQSDPGERPTVQQIIDDEWFRSGYMPSRLPVTCLTMAPRFPASATRNPLRELNSKDGSNTNTVGLKENQPQSKSGGTQENIKPGLARLNSKGEDEAVPDYYLSDMMGQLSSVLAARPTEKVKGNEEDAEDPAAIPVLWVSKWVDYSDKYGLGYQLCDGSVGVLFNDSTRLLLYADSEQTQYIERDGTESYHTIKTFPESLTKKVTLLKYFRNYMSEHLLKAGANIAPREVQEMARLPFLRMWFRTRSAIVLHLSSGTLQINFFQDHTKIILCPLMGAVTYIDEKRNSRTFRLSLIEEHGCSKELFTRLRYARTMVDRLIASKSGSGRVKTAT
ncbi:PREDICTED: serine/threonine-protein kinase PLK1-like [Branchiostoma belcheri]|uniref:Serine/threonine-protein kinase PLK n=1 Tax=Branchiostoma belcheri TaxID=7741 RepID=A0A6P4YDG5_BRABE|nr:PREDICTED: serine/threonine-protein kinase PLK1-like [Branchiostoma belcheri]